MGGGAKGLDKETGALYVDRLRALSLRMRALYGDVPTRAVILSHSRQHEGDPPFQIHVYPEHMLLALGMRPMFRPFDSEWSLTLDAVLGGAVCVFAHPLRVPMEQAMLWFHLLPDLPAVAYGPTDIVLDAGEGYAVPGGAARLASPRSTASPSIFR